MNEQRKKDAPTGTAAGAAVTGQGFNGSAGDLIDHSIPWMGQAGKGDGHLAELAGQARGKADAAWMRAVGCNAVGDVAGAVRWQERRTRHLAIMRAALSLKGICDAAR